jgi:hypothetical protein
MLSAEPGRLSKLRLDLFDRFSFQSAQQICPGEGWMRMDDCLKNAFCPNVPMLIGKVEQECGLPFRLELGRKLLQVRQRVLKIPECRADLNPL